MSKIILTSDEQRYILDNHLDMTVPEMAKVLGRGPASLYPFMKERNLPCKQNRVSHGKSHPFRKANRVLEAVCIQRKIDNRTHNPK